MARYFSEDSVIRRVHREQVGLLPVPLRRQYRLRWDPVRGLVHRGGAEYTRRLLLPLLPRRFRYNLAPATASR